MNESICFRFNHHHHRVPRWIHRPREPWGSWLPGPLYLHGGCAAQTKNLCSSSNSPLSYFLSYLTFFTNVAIACCALIVYIRRTVLQKTELLLCSACANNLSIQQLFPCLDLLLRQPTVKSEFQHKFVDILSTCTTVETIIWNISFLKKEKL